MSAAASTRGSAAAFIETSGPIPAGSPTVMAIRGRLDIIMKVESSVWTGADLQPEHPLPTACSELQHQPIGDDLRTGVSSRDRPERAVDRGKRAEHPIPIVVGRQPRQVRPQVGIGKGGVIGPAVDESDIPQQGRHRSQPEC